MRHPHDLVALQVGHLMDFYRGNARDLRDRIARALPHWSPDVPGYHVVLGMHAFGLEEAGDYARAEETGRRALDLEPLDAWAHHAVAHVMEMQGRAQDGIGWMSRASRTGPATTTSSGSTTGGTARSATSTSARPTSALALYDGPIRARPEPRRARPGRRLGAALAGAPLRARRRRPLAGAGRGLGRARGRALVSVQRPARGHGLSGCRAGRAARPAAGGAGAQRPRRAETAPWIRDVALPLIAGLRRLLARDSTGTCVRGAAPRALHRATTSAAATLSATSSTGR